jgi:hypothetical protein
LLQGSQDEPSALHSASVVHETVDRQMSPDAAHPSTSVPPSHAPLWASGFVSYPLGRPVQATLISVPSHAQPAEYASHTACGAGKHLPFAVQARLASNPQIPPVPQSVLVVQVPPESVQAPA